MSVNANKVREVLSKNILADGFEPIIDLEKSHHSWLVDERDGSEYLDMFSMYASGAIGYNHPEILAQKDKLAEVSLFKPTLSDIYSTQYADFLKIFDDVAVPKYLKNAFFIEGGALAVENALKTAFDWKIRKNLEKGVKVNEDMKMIHFKQAFHGRTGYTLSF
jgi:L-lysine 6-transaminase